LRSNPQFVEPGKIFPRTLFIKHVWKILEVFKMNSFSRLVAALVLVSSMLAGSVASFAQTTDTAKAQKSKEPTPNTTATASKKDTNHSVPTTPAGSNKPLSVNEDPAMIGKRNINKGIIAKMSGSTEKEVKLGRELAAEVDRQAKFVDDPVITEYINRVGQNIVLHSDAKIPFTIKVIDSDEVNAFALPGGFFYVNKGLILVADNEAEVAGVMAHEIGHVAARHALENQTKGTLLEYLAMGTSIFLGGIPGMIYQNTAGLGLLGIFMKFSRSAEEEADKLGVQYMYAAGYDPSAMATMFEKLEAKNKKKPGLISRAFASHPAPPDRRASALALAARFPETCRKRRIGFPRRYRLGSAKPQDRGFTRNSAKRKMAHGCMFCFLNRSQTSSVCCEKSSLVLALRRRRQPHGFQTTIRQPTNQRVGSPTHFIDW